MTYLEDDAEWDEEEQREARHQQHYRIGRLARAVKTFFPGVSEFSIVRALSLGITEINLESPPAFFATFL